MYLLHTQTKNKQKKWPADFPTEIGAEIEITKAGFPLDNTEKIEIIQASRYDMFGWDGGWGWNGGRRMWL